MGTLAGLLLWFKRLKISAADNLHIWEYFGNTGFRREQSTREARYSAARVRFETYGSCARQDVADQSQAAGTGVVPEQHGSLHLRSAA